MTPEEIIQSFTRNCKSVLKEKLVGVYIHGSYVMGCFNPAKSDIDLLIVIREPMTDAEKLDLLKATVPLNDFAPEKGIEYSVVRSAVCKPFVYPTPYELHFSPMHLERYRKDPLDYIAHLQGTDKDLAAHFTILFHRGRCLYGSPIPEVFAPVSDECYFDSIRYDIEGAREDILTDTTYIVLNLCRVLAYKQEHIVLSKKEGGEWGMTHSDSRFRELIRTALDDYARDTHTEYHDPKILTDFAETMLHCIM